MAEGGGRLVRTDSMGGDARWRLGLAFALALREGVARLRVPGPGDDAAPPGKRAKKEASACDSEDVRDHNFFAAFGPGGALDRAVDELRLGKDAREALVAQTRALDADEASAMAKAVVEDVEERHRPVAVAALLCACVSGAHGAGLRGDHERTAAQTRLYDARTRVALQILSRKLGLSDRQLTSAETALAGLIPEKPCTPPLLSQQRSPRDTNERKSASTGDLHASELTDAWRRLAIVSGTAILAGAAFAATGGAVVAPALASGLASLSGVAAAAAPASHAAAMVASAAAAAGTTTGTAVVSGAVGAYGGGMAGWRTKHLCDHVKHFRYVRVRDVCRLDGARFSRLSVTIGVAGWLSSVYDKERAFRDPFLLAQGDDTEVVALEWERDELMKLNQAATSFLKTQLISQAFQEGMAQTVLAGLFSAASLPSSMGSVLSVIDNALSVTLNRAIEAGRMLAHGLADGIHGDRPVTLLAFGLGARLVFQALVELGKMPQGAGLGIVQDVLLIGAFVDANPEMWRVARSAVAGRLTNAYVRDDAMLSVAFRAASATSSVAGLMAIKDVHGVENVDLTRWIAEEMSNAGHGSEWLSQSAYARLFPLVAALVGFGSAPA